MFVDLILTECLFGADSTSIHYFVPLLLVVLSHLFAGMWLFLLVYLSLSSQETHHDAVLITCNYSRLFSIPYLCKYDSGLLRLRDR